MQRTAHTTRGTKDKGARTERAGEEVAAEDGRRSGAAGGVQSLQRGLAILERVSQAEDGVTLARLSELTGMKKTTVHNLARTLLDEGYLARWTQPVRYAVGPALAALAGRGNAGNALHAAAAPLLLALAAEFPGSAAQLSEASGTEVRVTLRVGPDAPKTVERPVDRLSPPYISATSLVFLALNGDAWREACMRKYPFSDYGAPLWGVAAALDEQLAAVREAHHAVLEKPGSSLTPMAVPVTGARGEVLAALGLAYRPAADGTRRQAALARLHELARELGGRFGGGA